MANQRKLLTRVRLINWHYFENEMITIHGSTLISGENTAGKSTILDAIQLVLTTNTRRFNVAANEKGNRDLRGYVRCKVGNIGETYLRKNNVPANVALEFYEEKGERYFVIGVHMLSPDEESRVVTQWYREECRLEDLSFVVNGRAALADEFRLKGKKLKFIDQKHVAWDQFKRRLGNLDDKFFDIIPKSLAFKPMDNVKDFINKFVLSEAKVDVASLRENIETLSELEKLLQRTHRQLEQLTAIMERYEEIEAKDHAIAVNNLLIRMAERDAMREKVRTLEKEIYLKRQTIEVGEENIGKLTGELQTLDQQIVAIKVSINENEAGKLVEEMRRRLSELENKRDEAEKNIRKLHEGVERVRFFLKQLVPLQDGPLTAQELRRLEEACNEQEKLAVMAKLQEFLSRDMKETEKEYLIKEQEKDVLSEEIDELQNRLRELEKKILPYPDNTRFLKEAIEKEFARRSIRSHVYILAELLEITEEKWTNAVEGYFHTQKFYLIVEPEYYDVALETYHQNRRHIHSAGIINTKKLKQDYELAPQSLAKVIRSENRYALAYANYVLGRVMRCEDIRELEKYEIAMTEDCMLYQGYVARNLDRKTYENPFIGKNAYRVQIVNVKRKLEEKSVKRNALRERIELLKAALDAKENVHPELLQIYLLAPNMLEDCKIRLIQTRQELKDAENDPTLIELNAKLTVQTERRESVDMERRRLEKEMIQLGSRVKTAEEEVVQRKAEEDDISRQLEILADQDGLSYQEAREKYQENRRKKSPETIAENFAPQRAQLAREKDNLLNGNGTKGYNGLIQLQAKYNYDFTQDFVTGLEGMADYRDARRKLQTVEIVRYEEKLRSAKENCEDIFRSDFLSKMKEHIETARGEFKSLNRALDSIYYGDDSYRFKISYNKKKEGLYHMITSEYNQEGINLWTSSFEEEYKEEMADLFSKLMTKDDQGEKIVQEYTDYRSYLDYDIEIHKKDGSVQRFSDIYGEKSGSETQVPYYVAIAASFYQLYRYGNSVRLMLLDEAFDKMDDERILAMMDFFKGLDLQVILATPPAKIEIIGEKVDSVLTAIRDGQMSIVEEYEF